MKVSASASAEARTLAGIKTLKRRSTDQPQEGIGLREEARLCKWNLALKGETPRAGPARNKAGRCWADESLESVRNAAEAPEPGSGIPGSSGCPVPGIRRRGRNRMGGSRITSDLGPSPGGSRVIETLEGSERLREGSPGKMNPFPSNQQRENLKGHLC
jgi:hypothetical protein